MLDMLIRILRSLDWTFEWYILPSFYSNKKINRYVSYMISKWGQRFLDRVNREYTNKFP